jgi:hypothetical protein
MRGWVAGMPPVRKGRRQQLLQRESGRNDGSIPRDDPAGSPYSRPRCLSLHIGPLGVCSRLADRRISVFVIAGLLVRVISRFRTARNIDLNRSAVANSERSGFVRSFLLFRRLPSPAARLARRCRIPFARTGSTGELSERIDPVDRYSDDALMGNGSSNIVGTGDFSVLNRQTILGRRLAASGSRFDSDIPNAVIGWRPSERRPGRQEQRQN